nr:DUF4249 domain-containing protein [Gemmatimonadaceae bacterium]
VPQARLEIRPGQRYRLRVRTPDNREVTGETLVPSAPAGWVRGAGLAPRPVTFDRSRDTVRLSWAPSADARTYGIRVETPNGPWFLFSDSTRFALSGSLRNFFVPGLPSVWYPGFRQTLVVVAEDRNFFDYNRSGNDFFGGTGLISSVRGGIGLFGSLLVLETRVVTVTDRDGAPLDARWVGVSARGDTVEYELWVETAGSTASSVSGRVRSATSAFAIGILQGETLRLASLSTISARDTVAFFTGRVFTDSIVGTYSTRFATTGPTVFRRAARRGL